MVTISLESIYWSFRNVQRGYYLGTTSDGMIICNAKKPQTRSELWHIHLIPAQGATMFALRSIGRKRFARALAPGSQAGNGVALVNENGDDFKTEQIQVDATEPWGSHTLFQFKYYDGGRYALLTSSCKYLKCEGNCIDWSIACQSNTSTNGTTNGHANKSDSSPIKNSSVVLPMRECLFTIEYHSGYIAFRDQNGRYLAGTGRSSTLRTRSNNVSKDELFEFVSAPIQIALKASFNNKWVSIRQGMNHI